VADCHALTHAEVTVCGANVEACNGVYHDKEFSNCPTHNHIYENNNGGIIYFADGQWRLKTQKSSSDPLYAIDSDAAVPPIGKWRSQDGIGYCNVEVAPLAIVMQHPPDASFILFV
jgi:hypothetical protein